MCPIGVHAKLHAALQARSTAALPTPEPPTHPPTTARSRYQLEYSQAQDILDGHPPQPAHDTVAPADRPALRRNLAALAALAEHRRRQRLGAGAVELESAELRFATDAAGRPTGVTVKQARGQCGQGPPTAVPLSSSHTRTSAAVVSARPPDVQEIPMMRIVAEMMIFANAAVGQRIHAAFPRAALLRRHPPPRREAFEEVRGCACPSAGGARPQGRALRHAGGMTATSRCPTPVLLPAPAAPLAPPRCPRCASRWACS